MKTPKSIFVCTECGNTTSKWYGKCTACGAWNSLIEEEVKPDVNFPAASRTVKRLSADYGSEAISVDELELPSFIRSSTGMSELDRVLGGGLGHGSVVLLAGEP